MFILFDVGGTKIRVAAGDSNGFSNPIIIPTPVSFEDGFQSLVAVARRCAGNQAVTRIAGGFAGVLDRSHDKLVHGLWAGNPIRSMLEKEFNAPVRLENDAALAALGEAVEGAGKDHGIVGYVTVSTGVGGARIIDKVIDRYAFGSEPGYQTVTGGRPICGQCKESNLQAHISGKGIEAHYGRKPEEIKDPAVWEDVARYLALGLANTILHWSPDVMVLGGSVMRDIPIERVRELLKDLLYVYPEIPAIKRAALGDIGGLYGALALVCQMEKG